MANYQLTLTGAQVQALLDILSANNATSGQALFADGSGGVTFLTPSYITYTLSISSNVITLTGSNGSTSTVTLPVYNGGVS